MTDTKWTPGPWAVQVSEPLITSRATAFEIVTDDFDVVGGRVAIRNAADARLIAAAPDLYAALEVMIEWANTEPGQYPGGYPGRKAAQALAKARGDE